MGILESVAVDAILAFLSRLGGTEASAHQAS